MTITIMHDYIVQTCTSHVQLQINLLKAREQNLHQKHHKFNSPPVSGFNVFLLDKVVAVKKHWISNQCMHTCT